MDVNHTEALRHKADAMIDLMTGKDEDGVPKIAKLETEPSHVMEMTTPISQMVSLAVISEELRGIREVLEKIEAKMPGSGASTAPA